MEGIKKNYLSKNWTISSYEHAYFNMHYILLIIVRDRSSYEMV